MDRMLGSELNQRDPGTIIRFDGGSCEASLNRPAPPPPPCRERFRDDTISTLRAGCTTPSHIHSHHYQCYHVTSPNRPKCSNPGPRGLQVNTSLVGCIFGRHFFSPGVVDSSSSMRCRAPALSSIFPDAVPPAEPLAIRVCSRFCHPFT